MDNLYKDIFFINLVSTRFNLTKKNDRLWNAVCPNNCGKNSRKPKKKFYIFEKKSKGMMYTCCHKCGWYAPFYMFIEKYCPDLSDEYKFYGFKETLKKPAGESVLDLLNSKPIQTTPLFVTKERLYSLTKDFDSFPENHPARKIIDHRLIPYERVRYCNNFKELSVSLHQGITYKDYDIPCIVIPFHRANEQIEIIQARFFDPKVKPKYLTLKINPDALKIYNLDFVDPSKVVYCLEGPIDSMFVNNAVAMGGADGNVPLNNVVYVYDNEPDNDNITARMERKISAGEKIVVWNSSFKFKDINEGVIKKTLDKNKISVILRSRTFCGLKAKLELANYKSGG